MASTRLVGISILALVSGSLFSAGCVSTVTFQREVKRRMAAEYHIREFSARVGQLENARARLVAQVTNSKVREQELSEMIEEAKKAINWSAFDLEGGEDGELSLAGDLTFARGRHSLSTEGKKTLDKVAKALTQSGATRVLIEGHTDSDPIRATGRIYRDNLHLSVMRAHAVARHLISKDVEAKIISIAGYGPYKPRSKIKTENRRVEIRAMVGEAEGVHLSQK